MKNDTNIEELLQAAGFDFDTVDRCPDPGCALSHPAETVKAA